MAESDLQKDRSQQQTTKMAKVLIDRLKILNPLSELDESKFSRDRDHIRFKIKSSLSSTVKNGKVYSSKLQNRINQFGPGSRI